MQRHGSDTATDANATANAEEQAKSRPSSSPVDKADSTRETAPLKPAEDAVRISSTDLTVDEVCGAISEPYRGGVAHLVYREVSRADAHGVLGWFERGRLARGVGLVAGDELGLDFRLLLGVGGCVGVCGGVAAVTLYGAAARSGRCVWQTGTPDLRPGIRRLMSRPSRD